MPEDIINNNTALSASTQPEMSSAIHPDIEEGARHVLEEGLIDAVRTGNVAGIRVSISQLGEAWTRAQKAANATFEFTEEGRQVVPERVRRVCSEHMQEGLAAIFRVTEFGIQEGWEHSITGEPERVAEFYDIANELQVPLTYSPRPVEVDSSHSQQALSVLITTKEQALKHTQEIIDQNLPKGLHGIIKMLGFQVGRGLLKDLPDFQQRIERWINIMQERGWKIVDVPATPIMGEARTGLLPREVNRAEVRQLTDQAIRDNLAKGAKEISDMVGFQVRSGWFNPLSTWGTPENIDLYIKAGQRYGLTHKRGLITRDQPTNPDLYFDPTQTATHVREAVRSNLPEGLNAILNNHLSNIRGGNASQIEFAEKTLDQYIGLAKEYRVTINPDRLAASMRDHITAENFQQGVQGRLEAVRTALQNADYAAVRIASREADQFKKLVHDRGFREKVDFSSLDSYLKETATETPRLPEGNR